MKKKVAKLIRSIGFDINPSLKVRNLSIAHQQIVEIAKALSEKVKVLILDEPSAALGSNEIQKLFETLNRLREEGVAIIYITHHLDEIFQIADRVSVLKDGVSSETLMISETDREAVIQLMLGRSLETMYPERTSITGKEILRAENLQTANNVRNMFLRVRKGEILGIAGLVGSGRTETVRSLFGADKITSGKIYISGKRIKMGSPVKAVRKGIGMVPEDRKNQGIIMPLSIRENISLANFKRTTDRLGFIKLKKERYDTQVLINKLNIKTADGNMGVGNLSGGNQQKVSLAKWIQRDSNVLIIDEPTRGIDVGAKVEIYRLINEIADKGVAIIVVSSETGELMGICDRIIVMRKGKIQGELEKKDFSKEAILRLAIGA
jgi:ribose transport system ATP-binding protein